MNSAKSSLSWLPETVSVYIAVQVLFVSFFVRSKKSYHIHVNYIIIFYLRARERTTPHTSNVYGN